MRKFLDQYFGLIALAFIGASALAGGIVRRSLFAGFVWAALAVGVIILFFIFLGLWGAARERLADLRAKAADDGSPLAKEIAKAWAWGLVLWIPAQSLLTQFLMVWAAVGAAVIVCLPKLPQWSSAVRLSSLVVLVLAAGVINAAFHREP